MDRLGGKEKDGNKVQNVGGSVMAFTTAGPCGECRKDTLLVRLGAQADARVEIHGGLFGVEHLDPGWDAG